MLPRRACLGLPSPFSATMNVVAENRYSRSISVSRLTASPRRLGVSLALAARGLNISSMRSVTTKPPTTLSVRQDHREEAEHLLQVRGRSPEDEHRADQDDAVDGVRSTHQRRVQDARHLGDDLGARRRPSGSRTVAYWIQDVVHQSLSFTSGTIATCATTECLGGRARD